MFLAVLRVISFSLVPFGPIDPGSFPPCPGSMIITFSEFRFSLRVPFDFEPNKK